jgi:hypothetical protein
LRLRKAGILITLAICLSTLNSSSIASAQPDKVAITHEGEIVLSGIDSLEINSSNYTQRGNIIIRDNATLRITDSLLNLSNGSWIELLGNGQLIVDRSKLNLTGDHAEINAFDKSQISLVDSEVINEFWCTAHQAYHYLTSINMYNDTRMDANNSRIGVLMASGRSLSRVNKSFAGTLTIDQKTTAFVHVSNSSIDILIPQSGTYIIKESTVNHMLFYLMNGSYSCRFSLDKNVESWNSKKDGGGIPCDLTLQNTILDEFRVTAYNSSLEIRDSNPNSLLIIDGSNVSITNCTTNVTVQGDATETMEIIDSHIGELYCDPVATLKTLHIEGSDIRSAELNLGEYNGIEETRVGRWWSAAYYGWEGSTRVVEASDSDFGNFTINLKTAYNFSNVTVRDRVWIMYSFLNEPSYLHGPSYIRGGVSFQNRDQVFEFDLLRDTQYNVTRQYDVSVTRGGSPLPAASMELQSGNGTIWRGESDSEGKARFNVTYTGTYILGPTPGQPPLVNEENMTQSLTLLVKDRGDSTTMNLSLLSNTPVEVGFSSYYSGYPLQFFAILFFLVLVLVAVSILIRYVRARMWRIAS